MILILTARDDVHADRMEQILTARNADYLRFDPGDVPSTASITVGYRPSGLQRRVVRTPQRSVDLDEVTAVWVRRPSKPRPHAELAGSPTGTLVADECAAAVADLWETLEVRSVPAPRPVVVRAQYKARQLQLAGQLGFELPPTLVTNDPDEFLDFFTAHRGRLITKQIGLSQLHQAPDGDPIARYTEPVHHRDVVHASALRYCPMIVQAYVPKRLELRVTVVGQQVLAAAIYSQESHHTKHDWRRYDDARTVIEPYQLPDRVADRARALVRRLGLLYGAIDLVLTPDGRYVFLEINPSGQYLWVEDSTGLPITAAIADVLSGIEDTVPTSAVSARDIHPEIVRTSA